MAEPIERRAMQSVMDVAGIIAIIYTIGFLGLAALLYFVEIPASNKDALLYLFGILSGIELSIIAFFYGGSKAIEATQRATEQRQARQETVIQEIAKAAPLPPTTPVSTATPAPVNPATGITPAVEVASPPEVKPKEQP